ncbi:MAG: hypothetical protein QXX95_06685 [Nitrososphaerales archaeon]
MRKFISRAIAVFVVLLVLALVIDTSLAQYFSPKSPTPIVEKPL